MSLALAQLARSSRRAAVTVLPTGRTAAATFLAVRHTSNAARNMPWHMPDPAAPSITSTGSETPVDMATTEHTPIATWPPDFPADGPVAAATISGAPVELQTRTVRIYKPCKPATQSGHWNGKAWKMDWDILPKGGNWENPLMGWVSSADHMQGTSLYFKTKEDAIAFAERQGYPYYIQEPNVRQFRPKAYAANFTHSPGKLKMIRTK